MADDADMLHSVGRTLANSRLWPEWSDDSEFKAARDASAADRAGGTPLPPAPLAPAPQPGKGERGR